MKKERAETGTASRFTNFWYYYWKFILIGLAVIVVGTILIVNFVVKPVDVRIAVFSRNASQLNLGKIQGAFLDYVPDRNGDGTISLEILNHSPAVEEEAFTDGRIGAVQNSDTYLYLIDAKLFQELQALPEGENIPEGFADLKLKSPNCIYLENNGYNVIGSPFQEALGISKEDADTYFPDGLYLVLRGPVTVYSPETDGQTVKSDYPAAEAFALNILKGTPEKRG
ncbi:MAG: hypothetical protein HFJ85_00895 [Oscillospiraceae bacterium]|nr:hypothetical protein [Oscillospiraceae bacterium]